MGNILLTFGPFILIMGVMYFVMIRPQQQAAKKAQAMLDSLQKGDAIVTIGGLHGIIDELNEENKTVVLDCEGIYLTFERRAVSRITNKADQAFVVEETEVISEDPEDMHPE